MDWGQASILYRTDLVDIEEESWGLLWDERYAGRLAMIDSLIHGVMVAAIYAGAVGSLPDPRTLRRGGST